MRPMLVNKTTSNYEILLRLARISANGLLVGLWLYLYRPIFPYLGTIFGRQEFRTNQVLLLGALFLIILQVRKGDLHPRLDQLPQLYPAALLLTLASSAGFLVSERFLDVNTLSASLFGLASYGLLGLWLRPSYWQRGFPAALLLIGALPFGEHMQTFIGYPVRLLTAKIVGDGLSFLGVYSVGIDTILVFENSISKVDLPCSGVKSLWTGGLFLLATTWIERRRINLRWLASALVFAGSLLAANLARVAILVIVGEVAGWRLLAEMLHVPLGVLGFAGACVLAVALLRRADKDQPDKTLPEVIQIHKRPAWLPVILAGMVLILILLYAPRPQTALAQSLPDIQFPEAMGTEAWPLPIQVMEWLNLDGPVTANRWRFNWRGKPGSILIVASDDWRTNHHPERCFQAYGMTIQSQLPYLAAPDFPINLLSLQAGQNSIQMTAVYWLQSKEQVTDDYARRIWAEIIPDHQPWMQVTILFDEAVDARSTDNLTLFTALRQSVQRSLEGEASP